MIYPNLTLTVRITGREAKKAKDGLPNSLWETYSAFANCYGGVIILGVKENKDGSWYMTGLENPAKLRKDFWDTINNKNKVSVNLLTDNDLEIFEESNGIIMVVHVPKAKREQKPVYINGDMFSGTFRRNWEGDYHCDRSEVLAMLRDQPEETADMKILQDMSLEVLNSETVHAYRNRHMAYRTEHVWERLSDGRIFRADRRCKAVCQRLYFAPYSCRTSYVWRRI